MMTNIYVLELEGGNYYVGASSDIAKRFAQHINGQGSAWTKKFKPIRIEREHMNVSPYIEDALTKEYMAKYGIDKVRGGSYVKVQLTSEEINCITREIRGAQGLCTRCGKPGHFVTECQVQIINKCTRCYRDSHTVDRCYAGTYLDGTKIKSAKPFKSTRNNNILDKGCTPSQTNTVEQTALHNKVMNTIRVNNQSTETKHGEDVIYTYEPKIDNSTNTILCNTEENVLIDNDEWLFRYGQMIDKALDAVKEHIIIDDEERIIARRQKIDKALDNCCVIL